MSDTLTDFAKALVGYDLGRGSEWHSVPVSGVAMVKPEIGCLVHDRDAELVWDGQRLGPICCLKGAP